MAHGYGTGSLADGKLSPLDQLQMFERKYDPLTREILDGLPIGREWRCLEVGAGAGSIARWLAGRADRGSVLAIDVDASHLDAAGAPNMEVRQADAMLVDLPPGSFDLITARAVLEHLPGRDALLTRLVRLLAPGGRLLVEDFYYLPGEDAPSAVGRASVQGYVQRLEEQGADMRWARRMPAALAAAGLRGIRVRLTPAGPGQSAADDELIGRRLEQEGHSLVDGGLVSAAELAGFVGAIRDRTAWDVTTLEVSAWGRTEPTTSTENPLRNN